MDAGGYVYVDVRSEGEFEGGHPAEAYNVPWAHASPTGMVPNPDFMAVMKATFPTDAKLILGCMSGRRSLNAYAALEAEGYSQLVDQRAGWGGVRDAFGRVAEPGWAAEGLPTAVGPDPLRGYKNLKR